MREKKSLSQQHELREIRTRRLGILAGWAIVAVGLLFAASPSAGARLVGEGVTGVRRVCVYEDQHRRARAGQANERIEVGRGEPCPYRHPHEPPHQSTVVPSLATLEGQTDSNGHRLCYYRYLGRRYSQQIDSFRTCPMTPHFLGR